MKILLKHIGFLYFVSYVIRSERLEDGYYKTVSLSEGAHCFTLLNGTHQFGCKSSGFDSHGVVVRIKTEQDLIGLESCWRSRFIGYEGQYYLYIASYLLKRDIIQRIRESNCLKGLLLYSDKSHTIKMTEPLSAEGACPNKRSSFYDHDCSWNEKFAVDPKGLAHMLWDIQLIYITIPESINDIEQCINTFNVPSSSSDSVIYPFCALSLDNKQFAAGNSEICLRRSRSDALMLDLRLEGATRYCDPLTGRNVYVFVPPPVQLKGAKSIDRNFLLLAARTDSFGLIPSISPADFSVYTSLITLLAVTKAIGTEWEAFEIAGNKSKKHIIFTYFGGEAFDYIGSSHMMYYITNGKFPNFGQSSDKKFKDELANITSQQIDGVIELQHIGLHDQLNILMDSQDSQSHTGKNFIKLLMEKHSSIQQSIGKMPPSSWHHLKRINNDAVGIVLAPFNQSGYSYGQIDSMMDHYKWSSSERADIERRIKDAAEVILNVAANYVGLDVTQQAVQIDKSFINDLFECFIIANNFNCPLVTSLQNTTFVDSYVKTTYVGVRGSPVPNVLIPIAQYSIGNRADTLNVLNESACIHFGESKQTYKYSWLTDYKTHKSYCYGHSVRDVEVVSPAFIIEGYDFKNGFYSTYTESVFQNVHMKIFLLENSWYEIFFLIIGIVISLFSFLIIWRCEEKTFVVDEGEQAAAIGEPL